MKTAVVYYSYEGNCAFVAEQIKPVLNADLLRLETVSKNGFFVFIRSLLTGKKPALKPHGFEPSNYDLIVLGAPVWAFSPASAMQSFLSETKINGKKIALFLCHGGSMKKAMDKFKKILDGNTIVSEIDFNSPAKNDSEKQKERIDDWANSLKQ